MNEPFVVIENLSKSFSNNTPPSIQGINALIPKGEMVGILGPDGSGKTTFLRLIAGLLIPTEGRITINGFDTVKEVEQIRQISGYMPQKFGLYEELTVIQNLTLYADLQGVVKDRKEIFEKLLEFTGLAPFTNRLARALSGGMKQKLGLACALIKKPPLLLLDEPSVGVDPISRRELWKIITSLLGENTTIFWSTAYLDEAEKCDRVLLLNEGKLLFNGKPQELADRMKGRVFKLSNFKESPRQMLFRVLERSDVVDAAIQGRTIRVAMKGQEASGFNATVEPVPPQLEDAYIDILERKSGQKSELAQQRDPSTEIYETPVKAEELTKKYGSFVAVDQITFSVRKGEIFGLLGPNGAGKTTTFKMLCGLIHRTSGRALVNDLDLEKAPSAARAQIGYMAQKFSLYGMLSVKQNLNFFAGVYNIPAQKRQAVIDSMVKIFSLENYLDTTTDMLPLGFKQRLALACANMHNPNILFLDEPTSGVDPITRREFWNHIHGLVEKGVSILVTTHFMGEAEFCDRIALVYRGQIIHMDTPDALKEIAKSPENPNPTLEDAFIKLIAQSEASHGK
jgi:ABC-2 type transport system ATP-binding protein